MVREGKGGGEVLEQSLDVGETGVYLVDFALTGGLGGMRVQRWYQGRRDSLLGGDEDSGAGLLGALAGAGGGTGAFGDAAVGARPVLVAANLQQSAPTQCTTPRRPYLS